MVETPAPSNVFTEEDTGFGAPEGAEEAVVKIQSLHRGNVGRTKSKNKAKTKEILGALPPEADPEGAVMKIQSVHRGNVGRAKAAEKAKVKVGKEDPAVE